jgi:hypothetical protein
VVLLVVDEFQADGGEQPRLGAGWGVGEDIAEDRQLVQERGFVALAGGAV